MRAEQNMIAIASLPGLSCSVPIEKPFTRNMIFEKTVQLEKQLSNQKD